MGVTAKGRLETKIDQRELEASLVFTPDKEGLDLDTDKLQRVLIEAKLPSVSQKLANELLAKFANAKVPISEVAVRGVAPMEPSPETVEWQDLSTPPDLAEIAEATLLKAAAPEIYRVVIDKVKTEKVIKKANPIPFMPAKEEIQVIWEKVERREPVSFDTQVMGSAYVQKDQKIGLVISGKPGKPGKSVFSKPINIDGGGNLAFLLGEGIQKSGRDLVAQQTGFLRFGKCWADIIPLQTHSFNINRSDDGMNFLLDYTPGDARIQSPSAEVFITEAQKAGANIEELIAPEELQSAIEEAVRTGEPMCAFMLTKDRNALVEIAVSDDGLKALLTMQKGRGRGRPLDLRVLSDKIRTLGIKPSNPGKLKDDVLGFYKGQTSELKDYLLAEGKAPGKGKDRSLSFQVSFLPQAQAAKILDQVMGRGDSLKKMSGVEEFPVSEGLKVAYVQEGKQAASLPRAEPGPAGVDVFGKTLPGDQGRCPQIHCYDNVSFSQDQLTPLCEGILLNREIEGQFYFRVVPFKDSEVEVKVLPDGLLAIADITAGQGLGAPLEPNLIKAKLAEAGVVFGIEDGAIDKALTLARDEGKVEAYPLARGKAARAPGDAKVEWKIRLASGKGVTIHSDGQADFRNQDRYTPVKEGDLIAEILNLGDSGEAGMDVYGKPIEPGKAAGAEKLSHDESVREDNTETGVLRLYAAKTGDLTYDKSRLSVIQACSIKGNVDMKVGNLRFAGNVSVSGGVTNGFMVIAGGDVSIGEGVEAALISSDGNVRLNQGIRGQRKGAIRAKKGIEILFGENATLMAVDDIKVKNNLLACLVKTNGKLSIFADKGGLLGGRIKARKGVESHNVGSANFIHTEISFGQDYLIGDQLEAEKREIEKLKALLLENESKTIELARASGDLTQLRQEKVQLLKLMEKRSTRVFTLSEQFEEHFSSEIKVNGTIYPGVVLESHNRILEIRSPKSKVSYSFDPNLGHIVERQL